MQTVRENLLTLLALTFILALFLGALFFVRQQPASPTTIAGEAASATATATTTASDAPKATSNVVVASPTPLSAAIQATAVNQLLTDDQAALLLESLPTFAAEFNIELIDLEAQPRNPQAEESWYQTRIFNMSARGEKHGLINFVGHIRASTSPGVRIENLNITAGDTLQEDELTMDLVLYTAAEGGQRLITPTPADSATPTPAPSATATATATATSPSSPTPSVTATPEPVLHLVQAGETLFRIAKQYGVTVDELRDANGLTNNNIFAGQTLIIP